MESLEATTAVIIPAAGRGHRFARHPQPPEREAPEREPAEREAPEREPAERERRPKQYQPWKGHPLLRHSLKAFLAHPAIHFVFAVIHPDDESFYLEACRGLSVLPPVFGGANRQESVYQGLCALKERDPDHVLIHDAARPGICAPLIDRVLCGLKQQPSAVPCLHLSDSLKRVTKDGVRLKACDRGDYRLVQTPQGFRYRELLAAHETLRGRALSDDAAVAEAAGIPIFAVAGDDTNRKITTAQDLAMHTREDHPYALEQRVGSGFDVHRLTTGSGIMLCGAEIACPYTLIGHSDADVALHAVVDALLGALGAGDIGMHFPQHDERWKGASSQLFLRHACGLLEKRHGHLCNLDVTIICEEPKIGPHRARLCRSLADLLNVDAARVSVKATTTEGLGFSGRREGIAAQAIALIACAPLP